MKPLIYFDYAATTPADPEVIEKMMQCLSMDGVFGNPASKSHFYGWYAGQWVDQARQHVADLIHAQPNEIVWTSGATESNNLALKGIAQSAGCTDKHIITSQIEHKAILDSCAELEQQGFEVTYLQPEPLTGLIHPEQVRAAIRPDTLLISLMMVNNEIGTITDIAAIGAIAQQHGIYFHVDAAQAAGKTEIDVNAMQIDLLSLSAHKVYGPKGIGALYVRARPDLKLKAQMHGGGHEFGFRSGTLATHQIVGMGCAFALAKTRLAAEQQRLSVLRSKLVEGLAALTAIHINGHATQHVANYLNVSFAAADAADMIAKIKHVAAVSSGSACNSNSNAASHVLMGLQLDPALAAHTVRFSLGKYSTAEQIDQLLAAIIKDQRPKWISFD
ncbi:cysteine desulfurase [Acinetobacter calcoaceticus]|uniref:cysteine desulfurase n=1 Tax=Acinetobacter calcoaceticus TaxID=471 RepID=A0A4V2R008_ACICA|nr:cysteine desulfurase [Acinetobacter calcoaceticus]